MAFIGFTKGGIVPFFVGRSIPSDSSSSSLSSSPSSSPVSSVSSSNILDLSFNLIRSRQMSGDSCSDSIDDNPIEPPSEFIQIPLVKYQYLTYIENNYSTIIANVTIQLLLLM